jgi:uncharacterized protein YciI
MPHFVVVYEQGPSWVEGRAMREQAGWTEHAKFMNALADERVVLLGGPLGDGHPHRALLVLSAPDAEGLRRRLLEDPWVRSRVLELGEIRPWELLLGRLP